MLQLRRGTERFVTRSDGIESRHTFSFGEHYDPRLIGHGRLMVANTETLLAGRGFDDHPHADAEILTWVLSGSLVHTDSRGHSGVVVPGLAQRLSAGSGVVHAERNDASRLDAAGRDSATPVEPVRFVQLWLRPDVPGGEPSYAQGQVDRTELTRDWLPVASGRDPDAAVSLGSAGSTLWVTVLGAGVRRMLPTGPLAHLSLVRGRAELEGIGVLEEGDSVSVTGEAPLALTGVAEAEVLLWTLPQ